MKQREKVLSLTKKDFEVQTFCVGGHGGQNMQKNQTGVRIIHPASGATGEGRDERSQLQNRKAAFERLVASDKFQLWLKIEHSKVCAANNKPVRIQLTHEEIQRQVKNQVEKDLMNGNIIVESKDANGNWVKEK
jgi:protein subunit release factor B